MVKYFRFSTEYILWEVSYANMIMLLATIPSYGLDDEEEEIAVDGIDEFEQSIFGDA